MESRKLLLALLPALLCSSANADEHITIRKLSDDRWVIEDSVGRDLGTVRSLNDHTLIIESPTGKDLGTIRDDGDIDLEDRCGDERAALSCLLDQSEDE